MRLKAIWYALKHGLLPWWMYEKERHYEYSYWQHLWINLQYAFRWATFREYQSDIEFENKTNNKMVKVFQNEKTKGVLIKVPQDSSDYQIEAEYQPYSVWLYMKGRPFPMPIGNMIYPYRHDQLKIADTMEDADGRWLILEEINQ